MHDNIYVHNKGFIMKITKKNLQKLVEQVVANKGPRSIRAIAEEIESVWPSPSRDARPYLDAMHSLDVMTDRYQLDGANGIVAYFLSNARTFKGPDAKRIKSELNKMLKAYYRSRD